jgi:GT2 family glycosyltransferase
MFFATTNANGATDNNKKNSRDEQKPKRIRLVIIMIMIVLVSILSLDGLMIHKKNITFFNTNNNNSSSTSSSSSSLWARLKTLTAEMASRKEIIHVNNTGSIFGNDKLLEFLNSDDTADNAHDKRKSRNKVGARNDDDDSQEDLSENEEQTQTSEDETDSDGIDEEKIKIENDSFKIEITKNAHISQRYANEVRELGKKENDAWNKALKWKKQAAVKVMMRSKELGKRAVLSSTTRKTSINPPCKPILVARESIVDAPKAVSAITQRACRQKYEEMPYLSIGLVLSDKDGEFAKSESLIKTIITKVRNEIQKKLKASELTVFLDGDVVASHLLENPSKPFSKEVLKMTSRANDWTFASKHRNGNARVFNKLMRGTRAEYILLLREEDFLNVNDAGSITESSSLLDKRVQNIIAWASEALKLFKIDEHLAMLTPENSDYSSNSQGVKGDDDTPTTVVKPPSSSSKPNIGFFHRKRRDKKNLDEEEESTSPSSAERSESEHHLRYATPIFVRPNALHQIGGFEEWGTCSGDVLFDETLREMSIRLWRGGFKSAVFGIPEVSNHGSFFLRGGKRRKISLYANFATTESYPSKRYTKSWDRSVDGLWPFIIPGLTSDDIVEADMCVERLRSKRWKPFDSPSVVGNCFPPDVTAKGDPPKSILRQCKSSATREFPVATLIMQYFNRKAGVKKLLETLETFSLPVEIIINDDSRSELTAFSKFSKKQPKKNSFILAMPNDVHEIRAYNRLALMASAEIVALIQDDDYMPKGDAWLSKAISLFKKYPKLGLLGGYRGRIDDGTKQIPQQNQNDGSKYGAEPEKDRAKRTKDILFKDTSVNVDFMFAYKVNLAPMLTRRSLFAELGGFNHNFSCPGQPGIGLDFELSIRMWRLGRSVGLYDSKFQHGVGDSKFSGTHSGIAKTKRKANELRNNLLLYSMYPTFHHKKGTSKVSAENKKMLDAKQISKNRVSTARKREIERLAIADIEKGKTARVRQNRRPR